MRRRKRVNFWFYAFFIILILSIVYPSFFRESINLLKTSFAKSTTSNLLKENSKDSLITKPQVNSKDTLTTKSIKTQVNKPGIQKLVPSEMEEYGYFKDYHKSCSMIESLGESENIGNLKAKVCREACGKRDLEYYSDDCEKDLLVCYCSTN